MSRNKPTLVVLAAGMGSRYGGLKQIDTFTPEGDTIIDFSIYDALQAGFEKFVFIIRKSFEKDFREIFDEKLAGRAEVDYVFQELDAVPAQYVNPERVKPWGTGHALLMTKDVITENFAIINADDFYSKEAFQVMAKQLLETDRNSYDFSMVAYSLKNTVSEHGYVSRGECTVDEKGYLEGVVERERIEFIDGVLNSEVSKGGEMLPIDPETVVSMNFWGFTPKCFEFGTKLFEQFLADNTENLKAEFFLPTIVNEILKNPDASVKVLESSAKWFGVTYGEDKEMAVREIKKLKDANVYPVKLWS